jgi:hypothetical protein
MDNTVDSTLYMFTQGQKERMHAFLKKERNELLGSSCSGQLIDLRSSSELDLTEYLKAYPNPITNHVSIAYQDKENTSATLEIFSVVGELIHRETIGDTYSKTLSAEFLEPGIYIISITGINNHAIKIVKQ